jgi:DNA-binding response OmpR family regulator
MPHDLLVDGPFVIETAADGYEALVTVGTFRPALIILDVVLPASTASRRAGACAG